jgi:hypothetical protein
MVVFGGVLAILFSIALFVLAFRLNRAANETA